MKIFLKLLAIAAAFGMAPAAALAAPAHAPAAPAAASAAPAPAAATPATSAASAPSGNSVAAAPAVAAPAPAAPMPDIGQPNADRFGLQPPVSPIGVRGLWFHDVILVPLIIAIALFVLGLLLWVMFRYRRGANPVPTRNTHN